MFQGSCQCLGAEISACGYAPAGALKSTQNLDISGVFVDFPRKVNGFRMNVSRLPQTDGSRMLRLLTSYLELRMCSGNRIGFPHFYFSNISGKVNPEKLSRSASSDRLLLFCGALSFWSSVPRSILHTLSRSSIPVAYLCILKLQLKSPW